AQLHVVQNPCEASRGQYFIPHWPQPGLRSRQQQDRFKTVAFLGHRNSLAAALLEPPWETQLQQRGLQWLPVINTNGWNEYQSIDTRWNDYRHIDAIVAIRQFHRRRPGYRSKPATKLYNAWLAGVPAILGRELAYRAEGTTGINYLEANSMAELLSCIDMLQQDVTVRRTLVKNGKRQAVHYTSAAIVNRWQRFLDRVAIPSYRTWCHRAAWQRQLQQCQAKIANYCDRTSRRLQP
ncbi:MAG: hypothetical protein AAGI45_19160, partial [Cyanobacteria bacterium P01_H01_bin.26]